MENLVHNILQRSLKFGEVIYYWRSPNGYEVDFIVVDGVKPKKLIQVAFDIADHEVKKREIRALVKAMKELGVRDATMVTWEHEGEEVVGEKNIKILPLWKIVLGISC